MDKKYSFNTDVQFAIFLAFTPCLIVIFLFFIETFVQRYFVLRFYLRIRKCARYWISKIRKPHKHNCFDYNDSNSRIPILLILRKVCEDNPSVRRVCKMTWNDCVIAANWNDSRSKAYSDLFLYYFTRHTPDTGYRRHINAINYLIKGIRMHDSEIDCMAWATRHYTNGFIRVMVGKNYDEPWDWECIVSFDMDCYFDYYHSNGIHHVHILQLYQACDFYPMTPVGIAFSNHVKRRGEKNVHALSR
jgi:hypothetical protein